MELLLLVGVDHLDPNGPERLQRLLTDVRPDVVGLEDTQESFAKSLKTHRDIKRIALLLKASLALRYGKAKAPYIYDRLHNTLYESWVSEQYRKRAKCRLLFCDKKVTTAVLNQEIKDTFGLEKPDPGEALEKLLDRIADCDPNQEQWRFDQSYYAAETKKIELDSHTNAKLTDRDIHKAAKIRSVTSGSMVYIGGNLHMFGNYHPNLYDRLADLNPQRIRLCEVDTKSNSH